MTALTGLCGTNPRDFLAALGLLRVVSLAQPEVRLGFSDDGAFTPNLCNVDLPKSVSIVMSDLAAQSEAAAWRLEYEKQEKAKAKMVRDLKPPPDVFKTFLRSAISAWMNGHSEGAAYAAAFATDVAVDGKGNTKPTAFHMTAGQQEFIKSVEEIRDSVDAAWLEAALLEPDSERSGSNLRWDPGAERMYALMAKDPTTDGTTVCAPLEWLAFRALPLFPTTPHGTRIETTSVYRSADVMQFSWPLWSVSASVSTVRSLLQVSWSHRPARLSVGVIAVCSSSIRRSTQGYGNLGPASVIA